MGKETVLPPWIIFLLIALGVALAIGIALVLSQIDAMQQRALLPQATMPVIDPDATLAAGDLTVVVIVSDDSQTSTPTLTPTSEPETAGQATAVPTFGPIIVPTCSAAPDDWSPYEVKDGDELTTLALEFGTGVDVLLQANCLRHFQLLPGQVILVPGSIPTRVVMEEVCGVPQDWEVHIVRPGDTLAGLAQSHHTTVAMLVKANCLEETSIDPSRKLYLPPVSGYHPSPPTRTPGPPPHWTPRPPMMKPTPTKQVWPMPTPTSTPTKVPWPQDTATPTPSITATALTFVTQTPTNTPEPPPPTSTSGPAYPASLPSATPTATLAPPATATNTPSPTATSTPTPSPTSTYTPSPTATSTSSPTATGTATPSPTPTSTTTPQPYPYP